jgi:RNA polymerase sigma factor (sigma-70 family)
MVPARERRIIREIYLGDRTLQAVGEDLDLTKERVRQLKVRGINRIREKLAEEGLLEVA